MKRHWKDLLQKKVLAYGMTCALAVSSLSVGGATVAKTAKAAEGVGVGILSTASSLDVETPDNPAPFTSLTSDEMIADMGLGWNLGNTMDGHSNYEVGETKWQSDKTTKAMIKMVHDKGYNSIRIPVTWGRMINEDYSVYEEWIGRVQDIVDYAISQNMYAIINIHHDGADNDGNHLGSAEDDSPHGWLDLNGRTSGSQINDADYAKVKEKFDGLWESIADRFKNYDEHLLFESMNEVYGANGWDTTASVVNQDLLRINDLNQSFVNIVRASGSNNAKRWLVCPTRNTEISTATSDKYNFVVPTDPQNHVMVAVHEYSTFSLGTMNNSLDETKSATLAGQFKALKEKFVDNGVPVVLGEYGTLNNQMTVYKAEGTAYLARKYKIIPMAWDDNGNHRILVRKTGVEEKKDGYSIVESTLRGFYYDTDKSQIVEQPTLTPLTSFNVDKSDISIEAGTSQNIAVSDRTPANSNDVVVWSSADAEIASVYNGKIVGRAVGTTTITATSKYNSSVKQEIAVTVTPQTVETASTGIETDYETWELEAASEGFINGIALPEGNGAYVTYKSSDDSIVTVSTMGKLYALKIGEATITATTSDGFSKQILVKVVQSDAPANFDINLALHAFYNYSNDENTVNYSGTDCGETIRVTEDGTYTLTFDSASDLSDTAKEKGVTNLNGIGSLYIKDYDVTLGNRRRSPNVSGKIRYTSIKLDGKEILPKETKNYDALNGSGVFDTGNPMNVWELERKNITLNGASVYTHPLTDGLSWKFDSEDPQVITVTFKLSGFTGPVTEPEEEKTQQNPPGTNTPTADKLTVAKKAVTVAAGKSTSVAFSASGTPKLTTANKKIATAKISGKKIQPNCPI